MKKRIKTQKGKIDLFFQNLGRSKSRDPNCNLSKNSCKPFEAASATYSLFIKYNQNPNQTSKSWIKTSILYNKLSTLNLIIFNTKSYQKSKLENHIKKKQSKNRCSNFLAVWVRI